jgi:ribosomal protein S18 acetylase RimI-like enzyme
MAAAIPGFWRHRVTSCGGVVHEVDGLAVCLSGVPDEPFNPTLVERLPADPTAALEAAARYYAPAGLSFGIDLEASAHTPVREAADRSGLRVVESRPGMAVAMRDRQRLPLPSGVEIVGVAEPKLLDRVASIDAEAFEGDATLARMFVPDALLDDPAQRVYVAMIDGRIVGAGESAIADGVIGVFGIATVPAFRRRGVASALTSFLLDDRADEADLAVLQSSALGHGVYEALGFRAMSTWEVWAAS